jgi:choline transport protein
MILATGTWFIQGRKDFTGPRDLGALLELARAEGNDEIRSERQRSQSRAGSRSRSRARQPVEMTEA